MQEVMWVSKENLKKILCLCCFILLTVYFLGEETAEASPDPPHLFQDQTTAQELGKQWNANSVNRSIEIYLTLYQHWRQTGEFEKAADCLREISNFYIIMGKNDEAIVKLTQVLQYDRKYVNITKSVKTLSLLALASVRVGNIIEARKYADKALSISHKTNDDDAIATALYSHAYVNYEGGEFNQATESFEKALDLWQKDNNLHGQAKTLLELAYAYMTNDNLQTGLEKAEESLKISNQIGNLQYKVLAQNAIGVLKSKLGKKQEALNIFLQSEKEFPDGINSLEKGDMYNHLAGIYYDFDDLKLAQKYRLKALEIYEKEQNPFAQLATLSKLGIITFELGDENRGLDYFKTGFKLARQVQSDYFFSVLAQDLGNLYFETDKTKSLNYFKLAEPHFEKLKIRSHIAIIQSKIGLIYQSQKNYKLARKYFESSLKLNRETKNQLAESFNLYNLANLSAIENNQTEALDLSRQSIEVTDSLYSDVDNTKLKTTYFSSVYDRYELYINLLMKLHNKFPEKKLDIQALQAAEKSRARSILENLTLSGANFTKDANIEAVIKEKEIRNFLNKKADKLTKLLSQNADKAETDKISNEINELEHKLEEVKARLKQQSPIYSAVKNPAPFDIAEFQSAVLDENSLLLEFSFGKEESYLWLVGKTEVNSYVLPPRGQIETKIQKLRELLASRQMIKGEEIEAYQARIIKAENEYWQTAKQLSNELFGQAAGKFEKKRLVIVPDGKLNYFPVSALPLPNSETNEPILLSNEVVYEPSASTLSILAKSQNQTPPTKNLLVFSDPVFTKEDPRVAAANTAENLLAETASLENFRFAESLNSLSRLPASKTEADSIIEITGLSNTDNFSGFAASRERLLSTNTADYKILHFATHGLIDEQRPELSGIVLSRFDENGQKLEEFVRLQDIYGMNLNSDLVVLSACDTGIGKEVRGEGLQSLNNAFLQTGAKTVMSSLWKVEDNATLELMKNFYRSLANENLTPSQALQKAQIKMWQSGTYQSPFYWAAFTVQGDFRRTPALRREFPFSILFWAAGSAILLFGLAWLYRLRRRKARLLNRK